MVENATQIKSGTKIVDAVSVKILKKIVHTKKVILRILLYVVTKMINMASSLIGNSVIVCDEIIDGTAKSYDEEIKTDTTTFNKKKMITFLLIPIALLIAFNIH